MKKLTTILGAALLCSSVAFAADAPASDQASNWSMNDVTYIIGYKSGQSFQELTKMGLKPDAQTYVDAFKAGFSGADAKFTPQQEQTMMQAFQQTMSSKYQAMQQQKGQDNQKASQAFMAKIATEDGVKQLKDGLYYKVETAGKGPKPSADSSVTIRYKGALADGTVFDQSNKDGKDSTVTFKLANLIQGWQDALVNMPVGSKWTLYIAPELAYGENAPPQIGPNQALVFDIELDAVANGSQDQSS